MILGRFVGTRLGGAGLVLFLHLASSASAQTPAPSEPPEETVDFFGLKISQNERLKFRGELVAAWTHDGAQAALGFEKQGRVGMAILSLSGRLTDHAHYFVSINPVSETSAKPACGERRPEMETIGEGHTAACFRLAEIG